MSQGKLTVALIGACVLGYWANESVQAQLDRMRENCSQPLDLNSIVVFILNSLIGVWNRLISPLGVLFLILFAALYFSFHGSRKGKTGRVDEGYDLLKEEFCARRASVGGNWAFGVPPAISDQLTNPFSV